MTDKLLYKFVRIPDTDENVIYTDDPVFRVLYDEKVKWQLVKPFSFEWRFEDVSGDFIDLIENNAINDASIITRLASFHAELDQAIEINEGVTVLSSKPYPIYAIDNILIEPDFTKLNTFSYSNGEAQVSADLSFLSYKPILVTMNTIQEAYATASADFNFLSYKSIVVTMNTVQEAYATASADFNFLSYEQIVITYSDAEAESAEATADLTFLSYS